MWSGVHEAWVWSLALNQTGHGGTLRAEHLGGGIETEEFGVEGQLCLQGQPGLNTSLAVPNTKNSFTHIG